MINVKIKRTHVDAVLPEYAKHGDACLDLTAVAIITDNFSQITYDLGIALEIPDGYVGLIYPRSSIRKTSLALSNSVGVIDSGYRGTIAATFNKIDGKVTQEYRVGDRVCQLLIVPYPEVNLIEVDELSTTDRGAGGFGSTGN